MIMRMSGEYSPGSESRELDANTRPSYPKVSEFTRVKEQLQYCTNRDSVHVPDDRTTATKQMPSLLDIPTASSPNNIQDSVGSSEQLHFVKHEPTEGPTAAGEVARHDGERLTEQNLISEEPLEIQCGENSALLYVSKLCQGSKGPCILYNNSEWLTPNELQYISGRETAKDWKRSIRYKGKSLKSLIARGLIKVHPPICDCLGCRISSPVNRGRLASKCSLSPTSPRKRKDSFRVSPAWQAEGGLESAVSHRHFSAPDLDRLHSASRNGLHELGSSRESSSSTSECSEPVDDNPFSPVTKRPRSSSPANLEKSAAVVHRRASESSLAFFQNAAIRERLHYDVSGVPLLSRHSNHEYQHSNGSSPSVQAQQGHRPNQEENHKAAHNRELQPENSDSRSAFRTVFQDGAPASSTDQSSTQLNSSEGMLTEATMRSSKARSKPTRLPSTSFIPPFTQTVPAVTLVSPAHNSPRLVPDSVFLSNPHAANIYHHALRAGYPAVPPMPQSLLHYRLLSPTAQQAHAQAAMVQSLSLQNALITPDPTKHGFASNPLIGGKPLVEPARPPRSPMHSESNIRTTTPDKSLSITGEGVRDTHHRESDVTRTHKGDPDDLAVREETRSASDLSGNDSTQDRESVIQKSPISSPGTPDEQSNPFLQKHSSAKETRTSLAQQLLPRVQVDLNENVFKWTVDDVCHFVVTLTECPEVERVFREHHIDGQALVLLREDHLLNRMSVRLGPALKVLAQVNKLIGSLQRDDVPT